jgi:hypothetical protein
MAARRLYRYHGQEAGSTAAGHLPHLSHPLIAERS